MILKAYHQWGDLPFHKSCPHCARGQVPYELGVKCSICGAWVTRIVRDPMTGYPTLYMAKVYATRNEGSPDPQVEDRPL